MHGGMRQQGVSWAALAVAFAALVFAFSGLASGQSASGGTFQVCVADADTVNTLAKPITDLTTGLTSTTILTRAGALRKLADGATCGVHETEMSVRDGSPLPEPAPPQSYVANDTEDIQLGTGPAPILTMDVPAGDYVVQATVRVTDGKPKDEQRITCFVNDAAGTQVPGSLVTTTLPADQPSDEVAVPIEAFANGVGAGTLTVMCGDTVVADGSGGGGDDASSARAAQASAPAAHAPGATGTATPVTATQTSQRGGFPAKSFRIQTKLDIPGTETGCVGSKLLFISILPCDGGARVIAWRYRKSTRQLESLADPHVCAFAGSRDGLDGRKKPRAGDVVGGYALCAQVRKNGTWTRDSSGNIRSGAVKSLCWGAGSDSSGGSEIILVLCNRKPLKVTTRKHIIGVQKWLTPAAR